MYQLDLNILTFFLIFYIYSFMGWCFESLYVSIKTKKIVNRGFLNGPWLPIYGSGAVIILFSTIPLMNNPVLVYVSSVILATILELVTGIFMERLFKIKYWDYKDNFLNYKGYICLKSSITWGFMGLLTTYVINEPVAKFIDRLNIGISAAFVAMITLVFIFDFCKSFKAAFDIRKIILSSTVLAEDINEIKLQISKALEERKEKANQKAEDIKRRLSSALSYGEIEDFIAEKIDEIKSLEVENHFKNLRDKIASVKEKSADLEARRKAVIKRLLRAKDSTLNKTFEDFASFF